MKTKKPEEAMKVKVKNVPVRGFAEVVFDVPNGASPEVIKNVLMDVSQVRLRGGLDLKSVELDANTLLSGWELDIEE